LDILSQQILHEAPEKYLFIFFKAKGLFSAAAGLPVCRPYRQSAAEVGPVLNNTSPCQEIPPTTFWHCNPYSALKL